METDIEKEEDCHLKNGPGSGKGWFGLLTFRGKMRNHFHNEFGDANMGWDCELGGCACTFDQVRVGITDERIRGAEEGIARPITGGVKSSNEGRDNPIIDHFVDKERVSTIIHHMEETIQSKEGSGEIG